MTEPVVLGLPPGITWPFAVAVAAVLGSFLNVCISRLPRGESVVLPASHCPGCQTPIRYYDNIPLVSFVVLGGRCRACRTPISWRYPLVEALAVGVGLLALWRLGPTWEGLRVFVLGLALIAVAFTDLETQLIPDRVTLPGVVVGLASALESGGRGALGALLGGVVLGVTRGWLARPASGVGRAEVPDAAERRRLDALFAGAWGAVLGRQLAVIDVSVFATVDGGAALLLRLARQVDPFVGGCLLAGGIFYLIAVISHGVLGRTGMGGGDVKLAAMLGAFLGFELALVAVFLGILAGGVTAILLLLSGQRRLGQYLSFGPFLASGGLVAAFWGQSLLVWYLG